MIPVAVVTELAEGEFLTADGFEEAFVGLSYPWQANRLPVAVYDYHKVIDILMERDGMDYEGAVEFFEFNIAGAYVGPHTPIYVSQPTDG